MGGRETSDVERRTLWVALRYVLRWRRCHRDSNWKNDTLLFSLSLSLALSCVRGEDGGGGVRKNVGDLEPGF